MIKLKQILRDEQLSILYKSPTRDEGNNYKVKLKQKNGRKEEVKLSFRVADCSFDVMQIVFEANNASRQFPTNV